MLSQIKDRGGGFAQKIKPTDGLPENQDEDISIQNIIHPWKKKAGLDTGDVVDPTGTGTGDNISVESGFRECTGLRTCGIRLVGQLGELG